MRGGAALSLSASDWTPGAAGADTFDGRILDPAHLQDPYALYADLRSHAPVHWSDALSRWLVTSHEHVIEVLSDAGRFSSQVGIRMFPREHWLVMRPFAEQLSKMMIFSDGEAHRGLRGMMRHAFDGRAVKSLAPIIEGTVLGLLDRLPRETDLISEYAEAVPLGVISVILGIPEEDVPELRAMATQWVTATAVFGDRQALFRGMQAMWGLRRYFARHNAKKRADPGDDLISRLVEQQAIHGLGDDVMTAQAIMLFVTGHETVQSSISSGCWLLSQRPELVDALLGGELSWRRVVEEVLRFESPAQAMMRIATEDLELAGMSVRAGEAVVAGIGAANRDPAVFDRPDQFDPWRSSNRHLSFGVGAHTCPAAGLGRTEIVTGLRMLFERYPTLRVERTPRWSARHNFRSLAELSVSLW